jgi:DNA-binding MarR family transcriptional regulator
MPSNDPLPTLLSQPLVAFTIEFDNEFEQRMPHRMSGSRSAKHSTGPLLSSMVMWSNLMQYLGDEGLGPADIKGLARTNLPGLQRWGYVEIAPDGVVRASPAGRRAQQIWRPLAAEIEQRWMSRFGEEEIRELRRSLLVLVDVLGKGLPRYLPVVGYGMFADVPDSVDMEPVVGQPPDLAQSPDLSVLLSNVLLAYTIEFERDSKVSLTISANVLRVLGDEWVPVRELPKLTGVSKEAVSMSVGYLERTGHALVGPDPSRSRGKAMRLTEQGKKAQARYNELVFAIEDHWAERFGPATIGALRESLEQLVGDHDRLWSGLEPYPDSWRAASRRPGILPHHPMVLHRGGYPDGS